MIDRMFGVGSLPTERLRSIGSMPRDARRALERAHERRGRRRAKKRRAGPRKMGREDVAALIRGMREAVEGPEARFFRATGTVPVAAFLVPAWKRQEAARHARAAARELGTDEPELRWFRTAKGGLPARGFFARSMPDTIWLSADVPLGRLPLTIAHECRHRADHLAGRKSSEESAEAFEAKFVPVDRGMRSQPRWLTHTD